jgi:RimJ/RimL family protein N-acetyltransferase
VPQRPVNASPPRLETNSLRLRCFALGDAAAVHALNREDTTRHWLPSHVYQDVADAEAALRYLIDSCSSPGDPRLGPYVLGVEHLGSGALIGHVGFSPLDDEVEISFAVGERFRCRGHAVEAIVVACRWVCSTFGLRSLVAVTAIDNTASQRTLDRCGFTWTEDKVMNFQGSEGRVRVYRFSAPAVDHPS